MERTARIELAALAWKAKVLPLYDVRFSIFIIAKWWREVDSNHRRLSRQIYNLIPLATREPLQYFYNNFINGADCRSRTGDLLITSQLLYQLS
jgi:hypothetical protein